MKPLNPRQQKILALIEASPEGVTRSELYKHVHCYPDTLRGDLHLMRDRGLIAVSADGGRHAKWALAKYAGEIRAKHEASMRKNKPIDPAARERGIRSAITRKANQAAKAAGIVELPQPAPDNEFLRGKRVVVPAGAWTAEPRPASSWIPL